ncbi:trypsin alpha-3 isoform X2 [Drosophila innubila]|nr:trypsin alpha-3 isoform X2 [Drosophila innubila]
MHLNRTLVVVGGTPNRLKNVDDTVTRRTKNIFVPKNFLKKNTNNIALLQLYESWPLNNPSIDIIKLPSAEPNNTTQFMVLGWGRFYKGGPLAGNLVHIKVKLLDRSKCQQIIQKLQPEMLCAGNVTGTVDEDPCAGDTGGPMIYNHTIYGLVSYRLGCGQDTMPSIYTDVWYHMDWINETIRNCCCPCLAQAKLCISLFVLITLSVWKAI